MADFTSQETTQKSEFNEAFLKMKRLSELQTFANLSQVRGEYHNWFNAIAGIFKEIIGKLEENEKTDVKKKLSLISLKIKQRDTVGGFDVAGYYLQKPGETKRNLESELFDLDCQLRELIDKHGFGAPDEDESDLF